MHVAAGQHTNLDFTLEYASPQLLPYAPPCGDLGPCPMMDDMPNDMWAFGGLMYRLLTCTNPGWRCVFGPKAASPKDWALSEEQLAARKKADVAAGQNLWV